MNILNLPDWDVYEIKEGEYDYVITARYIPEPVACIRCGVMGQLYRHGVKKQRFMDLPIHGKRAGIMVNRQRYHCRACHQTSFQPLPDMEKNHAATKRLIEFIGRESMKRTFVSVADDTGIHERTVRRLFMATVKRLEAENYIETPVWLGIDEVHLVKRARCILTNVQQRTVIDLLASRTKDVVSRYLYKLPNKDKIELVTMDMWQPYRDAVKDILPQAAIVIDKFHVVRLAIQGMDTVRKQTRSHLTARQVRTLKRDRYILFHRKNELDEKDKFILATWIGQFPSLGKAYQLKEEFCDLWLIKDKQEAQERYLKWMMDVPTELEPAFQPLISAMTNWKPEILSYWDYPVTNAYTEALAGLVKLANRIGRGYSFQAIRAKILYSGLPTVHKPVFNRVLEERLPFRPMAAIPEVKNYGIPFSTLYELWEKGMDCEW
ncbi:MAG: ISL3 family transposase [Candidatus Omnitrophica bacterium]|jgi:transposase|nr:ISL3 family transposase [Candidatus Omnitrophota bacterium]